MLSQARLCIRDGCVVDHRPDLLEKEVQQKTCGQVADRLRQVALNLLLERGDRLGSLLLRKLGHHSRPLVLGSNSRMRSSREHAPRMARANALKIASIL